MIFKWLMIFFCVLVVCGTAVICTLNWPHKSLVFSNTMTVHHVIHKSVEDAPEQEAPKKQSLPSLADKCIPLPFTDRCVRYET